MLREILEQIPPELRDKHPACRAAAQQATARCVNVVQLIYQDKEWDGLSKDYEFGAVTMRSHWESGLTDINKTLEHPIQLASGHLVQIDMSSGVCCASDQETSAEALLNHADAVLYKTKKHPDLV